jgi:hypothetical protein
LKLTLDSTEPLDDAMRVLGALYGVTLVVSPDEQDGTRSASSAATTPGRKSESKPAGSQRTVNSTRSAAKKKTRPVASSAKTVKPRSRPKAAQRSVDSSSNAEVRSWARRNGFTVSDRGRLPASVVTAYRNAQSA